MKNISLCYTHQKENRTTVPQGCPTCRRINIERDIVLRTVAHLLAAGFYLNIMNGGDGEELAEPSRNVSDLTLALMETDDEYLQVYGNSNDGTLTPKGWVRFVYGNDGYDVIFDYTTNLDPVLDGIIDYIDKTYT
jgi:hypothetical protein